MSLIKICSAPTPESLSSLINSYFYSTNWQVLKGHESYYAYNPKMEKTIGEIQYKKGKLTFYMQSL